MRDDKERCQRQLQRPVLGVWKPGIVRHSYTCISITLPLPSLLPLGSSRELVRWDSTRLLSFGTELVAFCVYARTSA